MVDLVSGGGDVLEAGADIPGPSGENRRNEEKCVERAHNMMMALIAIVHDGREA